MRIKYRFTDRTDNTFTQAHYWVKWNPFKHIMYHLASFCHDPFITMEQRHQGIREAIIYKVNYKQLKDRTGEFTL